MQPSPPPSSFSSVSHPFPLSSTSSLPHHSQSTAVTKRWNSVFKACETSRLEMPSGMEGKQHTPSVVARFLGLDEFPPQQHLPVERSRVFSENYLQKTASICLREKSSISVGLSRGINAQKHQVVKDVSAAKLKMQKYTNSSSTSTEVKHSYLKYSKSTSESLLSAKRWCDLQASKPYCHLVHSAVAKPIGKMSARTTAEEKTLRSLQTHEIKDDIGECSIHHLKKTNFQLDPNANIPHPCTRTLVKGKVLELPSSKLRSAQRKDDTLNFFSKRPSFSKDIKKQNIERWKLTNDLQEVETTRRSQNLGEMLATDELETKPQFLDSKRDSQSFCSSFSVNTEISGSCSENSPIPNHSAGSRIASGSPEGTISHKSSLYGWHLRQKAAVTEKHSKSMNQKQKYNVEYRDLNLKETDQHSPNSVLEPPSQEEKPCTSAFHGLCSVAQQLQFLETNSEETYSEGSEMGVSSDGDSETQPLDLLQDSENILIDFKTADGRDFSYLVDVLDEASLHGMNLGMCFETWNSLECPVNPSVFDLLEKKYGKQTSWLKSERKLLFDHINSGLSEILHSFLEIYIMEKSLKRRCCSTMRRIDIEEELWRMLVSHENEMRKDLSGKAIGNETKWLQVEEEIGSICREIETYLLDELATELALH